MLAGVGKIYIPQKKPFHSFSERSFEIGRIFALKSSRQVLLEVMLFQLGGRGYPLGVATNNFFHESKCSVLLNDQT